LSGLGFGAHDPVVVRLGHRTLARTRTNRRGNFSTTVRIPARRRGRLELATRSRSRRVVNLFVASKPPLAPDTGAAEVATESGQRLRWTPLEAPVGTPVRLRGWHFPRKRQVRISVGGFNVGAVTSTRGGSFSYSFPVPRLLGGRYALLARAASTSLAARFSITVDPLVAAAGDIACDPEQPSFNGGAGTPDVCHMRQTSDLVLGLEPSLVLMLGDGQYEAGSLQDYLASYDRSWGRFKAITRPVPGNHEYGALGAIGYFDYFNSPGSKSGAAGDRGKGYYSFDVGTWHVIALNSNCTEIGVTCAAGSPQEQWLRADLAAHPNRCVLAFWHHPLYSSGQGGNHPTMHDLYKVLYDAKADLVLTGHDHYYERFSPQDPEGVLDAVNGIRQFIVGTGGRDLQRTKRAIRDNSEVRNLDTYGVLSLRLRPGYYEWRFLPEAGRSFTDSSAQACH
jgi:calcineurin-like phosphoesterase family protein